MKGSSFLCVLSIVCILTACEEKDSNKRPSIQITSHEDNETIYRTKADTITVDVSDADGTVDKVMYYIDDAEWAEGDPGYCWYNNDSATHAATYGALYNFYAMETTNICPEGWHVPTDAEYMILEMALGMSEVEANNSNWRGTDEGGKIKEAGTAHWESPNTGATNESGFTLLPAGSRGTNGTYDYLGISTNLWTSTTSTNVTQAWIRVIVFEKSNIYRTNPFKRAGRSIRCLKD